MIVCPVCTTEHGARLCPKCGHVATVSQPVLFRDARVAVLLFDRPLVADREHRSATSFDSMRHVGIRKVCGDLNEPFDFCTPATMDRYEAVLVPLHSFLDVCNVMLYVPERRKAKVVVGGPACTNIRPMVGKIDVANFGRCDLGKINRILAGERMPSVWRAADDAAFTRQYIVDHATADGLDPTENNVGCHRRCLFCLYAWWNGPTTATHEYRSGFGSREDFFTAVDWAAARSGAVTAIDGQTEAVRRVVGKPLSVQQIVDALTRSNSAQYDKALRVKVYTIVGYPGETARAAVETDMVDACRIADGRVRNQLCIVLKPSHFIPCQSTPMWGEPFNLTDMRPAAVANQVLFAGEKITLYSGGNYVPTPMRAAVSTVLQRAGVQDGSRVLACVERFARSRSAVETLRHITESCGDLLDAQSSEIMANVTTGTEHLRPQPDTGRIFGGGEERTD